MGYPQVVVRRSLQHDRRSDVVRLARQPQLRALRQRACRSRRSSPEVRRLSVPPASSIRSTRPTRAATSPSTASGRATRSPISCSAIRASSQVGIGRADEHGRSTWFHVYGQDDWKVELEPDAELRPALRDQQPDDRRRQSAVGDRPAGRRASSSPATTAATSRRTRRRCCRRSRFRTSTSQDAGWTQGLLRPSYLRFAPRARRRLGAGRCRQDRRQRRVRRVPESVGLQRAAGARVRRCRSSSRRRSPPRPTPCSRRSSTDNVLLAPANGTVGGSTMDWDFRTEYAKNYSVSVQRQLTPTTMIEVSFLRSAIVGADSSTVRNVPEPGPGAIGPRRPCRSSRNITAIRWDGYSIFNGAHVPGRAAAVARPGRVRVLHAVEGDRRCVRSRRHGVRSQPAAGRAQHGRRGSAVPASTIGIASSAASRTRCPAPAAAGSPRRSASGWQVNGIVLLESGAPFTVNLGTDRANIGAGPAQRPDQTCDPNQGGARTAQQWFNTACFALQPQFTFGNAPRNSVLAPGYANVDIGVQKDVVAWQGGRACSSAGKSSTCFNRDELRRAEPHRVHAELRADLQREAAAADAVRREVAVLINAVGSRPA